jgi:hypothetical protein
MPVFARRENYTPSNCRSVCGAMTFGARQILPRTITRTGLIEYSPTSSAARFSRPSAFALESGERVRNKIETVSSKKTRNTQSVFHKFFFRVFCVFFFHINSSVNFRQSRQSFRNLVGKIASRHCQNQFPELEAGRFIRASLPKPSKSCIGAIAVFATDSQTRGRNPSEFPAVRFRYSRQNSRSFYLFGVARRAFARFELNQPTVVSLSCVPV